MNKRPHIVIFNPDQFRSDGQAHLGNPAAVTPNLDRLAATDAVSFRNAFCQNPVCTPSRCSFMTGWYPHTRGHRTMTHALHVENGEPVLLRQLRDAGYHVWWGGKNDLLPGQLGWADCVDEHFQPTADDFARWGCTPRGDLHNVLKHYRGRPGSDTYYSFYVGSLDTEGEKIYCDQDWAWVLGAVERIRNAPPDKPLCLYLPLKYPHPPYGVEEPFYSQIDRHRLPPRIGRPDWTNKPSLLRGMAERQNLQGWTEDRWTELRATYYGMCARVDAQLGMILQALREAGLYDDTAVFFFADHGDFIGDYGLVEKTQNTFEDCLTRVPLVVKPPVGVDLSPRISDALVELIDFTATVYDLAGITPDYSHFGRSLRPVLSGQTDTHRDAVFCEGGRLADEPHCKETLAPPSPETPYWPRVSLQYEDAVAHGKAVMVRTSQFKYVRRLYETDELYDLQADPGETVNRIADPALAAPLAQLKERLLTFFMETADVVPHEMDQRGFPEDR